MVIVNILLWILKIAGILLLLVLGLLLLGLLVILFVPIRYELSAQGNMKEPEKIKGWISVRYFFSLIRFRAAYENENFHWEAGIAWKKIGQDIEEGQEQKTERDEMTNSEVQEDHTDSTEVIEKKEESPAISRIPQEPVKEKKTAQKEQKKSKERKSKKTKEEKKSFTERIKYTFQKICAKIKSLSDMKDRAETFIKDETHQAAFKKVKKVFFVFLKKWMPKKIKGYVEYGFDDPYYTGKILAWLAIIYPFFGKWVQIVPDFEKTALKGDLYMKGHLRMNHLAAAAIKLAADKNIRSTAREVLRLIKRQKKEES